MQEIIIYILVGGACAYLLWKFLKPKSKKGCNDCNC